MFTGIIETIGTVVSTERVGGDCRMVFSATPGFLHGANLGDSIATSGVCLTAVTLTSDTFAADLSAETLNATTAASWAVGRSVNLERALTPSKPLGGHMVSGHVDGVGHLVEKFEDARSWRLVFEVSAALGRYIASKGSICVDGVSLTVNEVEDGAWGARFGVNIIPHTARHTTLGQLTTGQAVNLEVDVIARYLERLLSGRETT